MIPKRPPQVSRLVDPYGRPVALAGTWKGGRSDRDQSKSWKTFSGSADEDNIDDLPKLRDRSHDLYRNHALAGGAIETACLHVVGTGLTLQAQVERSILGWEEDRAIQWQTRVETLFGLWAASSAADMAMDLNFYEQQDLGYRTALVSGDALVNITWRERPGIPFGTCLQIIEGHRLANKDNQRDSSTLVAGVALDSFGAPRQYHVLDQHPGSRLGIAKARSWTVLDAFTPSGRRNVIHLKNADRPEQHRGIPFLAPVMESLKELGEYTDGELRAAVVSGLSAVFIKSAGVTDPATGEPVAVEGSDSGDREIELGYGAVHLLDPGEDIEHTTPGRPNPSFDPFVLAVLRQIGRRLNIPFEILIGHFTSSFSAARAALLEMGRFVRRKRDWLAARFCQPVYEAFLEELVLRKLIEAPGFLGDPLLRMAYCGANWIGDSQGHIDLKKEVEAWTEMVNQNFATKTQATVALTGGDFERNVERRNREHRLEEEAGILPIAPPAGAARPTLPDPEDPEAPDDPTTKEQP